MPKTKTSHWTPLYFGKHRGRTLPRVMFLDPDWFFWAYDEDAFVGMNLLEEQADEIYKKARAIKVPPGHRAVFFIHPPTRKFVKLQILPKSELETIDSWVDVRPQIDLSVPRSYSRYDKRGYRLLLKDLKAHLFGSPSSSMTRSRCEEFFDDEENFEQTEDDRVSHAAGEPMGTPPASPPFL